MGAQQEAEGQKDSGRHRKGRRPAGGKSPVAGLSRHWRANERSRQVSEGDRNPAGTTRPKRDLSRSQRAGRRKG